MSKKTKGIVFKNNKALGMIWHPESGLVLKSKDEKIVVGQCVDDELIPLNDEIVELCNEWHLKYDESLLKKEEPEEEEVEEEEAEPEEEPEEEEAPKVAPSQRKKIVPEKEEDSGEEEEPEEVVEKVKPSVKPTEVASTEQNQQQGPDEDAALLLELIRKLFDKMTAGQERAAIAEKSLAEKSKQLQAVEKELSATKEKLVKIMSVLG